MTTTLTATSVAPPATLNVPAPGDSVTSAGVQAYVQSLMNGTEYVRERTPGCNVAGAGNIAIPYTLAFGADGTGNWTRSDLSPSAGGVIPSYLNSGSLGAQLYIPLNGLLVPNGMRIMSFNVLYCGSLGHGSLPGTMPKVELVKQSRGVGGLLLSIAAPTVVDSVFDGSGSFAAFQNIHFISKVLATPELFDNSQLYSLRVTAESGGGAQNSARVLDNGYIEVAA